MSWAALTRDTLRKVDMIAAMGEVLESMERVQENRILDLLLAPPPASIFTWPKPAIEEVKPAELALDMRLHVMWSGMVMAPKHSLLFTDTIGCGPPELRCGPYTTPSGKQWAVVRDRGTGRRRVVDWPLA